MACPDGREPLTAQEQSEEAAGSDEEACGAPRRVVLLNRRPPCRRSCAWAAGAGLAALGAVGGIVWRKGRHWEAQMHHRGKLVDLAEMHFKIIDQGKCADHGYLPISDLFYCEASAMELGLADLSAIPTDFLGIPEGCYYFEDQTQGVQGLWLDTNLENKGNGAQVAPGGQSRKPICSASAPPSTSQPFTTTVTTTLPEKHEDEKGEKDNKVVDEEWKVGDIVRVKDNPDERWEYGFVTGVHPLEVKPHGWRKGFPWNIAEHIDIDSLLPNTASTSTTVATTGAATTIASTTVADTTSAAATGRTTTSASTTVADTTSASTTAAATTSAATTTGEDSQPRTTLLSHDDRGRGNQHQESKEGGDDKKAEEAEEAERIFEPEMLPKEMLKGVCYAPVPSKHPKRLDNDDFMSETTDKIWSRKGRGDLALIASMGANTVRLYGNDPTQNHEAFLDELHDVGLKAIVDFSDYPYIQMAGNCIQTDFDCFTQIKDQYANDLKGGFLKWVNGKDVHYHPGIRTIVLQNEPDLKFFPMSNTSRFCKAMVSAFDGVLEAEKGAGVGGKDFTGHLPNITVTFSFAVCMDCHIPGTMHLPAIGQMLALRKAMEDPSSVGYKARNDLWKAYKTRFENSFNTANPASDIKPLFLDMYDEHFQGTPVFIGEYHTPKNKLQNEDLKIITEISKDDSNLLAGFVFFEFQVRYDKGGSELMFGMFGLGEHKLDTLEISGTEFNLWCLTPMMPPVERQASAEERSCGLMEEGVIYIIDTDWSQSESHVETPDGCCTRCKDTPRCQSWSWDKTHAGLSCILYGQRPEDDSGGRLAKKSAVSGLPPPRSMTWRQDGVLATVKDDIIMLLPETLTQVFEGKGIDYTALCKAAQLKFYMYA